MCKKTLIWLRLKLEKTLIKISGVKEINEKRILVTLKETGEELWLPLSQAERFGDRVFIPDWLAERYNQLKGGRYARNDRKNQPS